MLVSIVLYFKLGLKIVVSLYKVLKQLVKILRLLVYDSGSNARVER